MNLVASARAKSMQTISYRIFLFLYFLLMSLTFAMLISLADAAEYDCGSIKNHYGPYDYANPDDREQKLPIVERAHFNSRVENLIGGSVSSNTLIGDLEYTLRTFPNHYRALYSIIKYDIRERQKSRQEGKPYKPSNNKGYPATAECYIDRAIRWRPNDPNVYLLYGIFLHLDGRLNEALQQYKISEKIQPNSADLQYNLGLLHFDRREYVLAKEYAKKAYQLGYPLPGLRKKLTSVGQWP